MTTRVRRAQVVKGSRGEKQPGWSRPWTDNRIARGDAIHACEITSTDGHLHPMSACICEHCRALPVNGGEVAPASLPREKVVQLRRNWSARKDSSHGVTGLL